MAKRVVQAQRKPIGFPKVMKKPEHNRYLIKMHKRGRHRKD